MNIAIDSSVVSERLRKQRIRMSPFGCFALGGSLMEEFAEPAPAKTQTVPNRFGLTEVEIERRRAVVRGCGREIDITA